MVTAKVHQQASKALDGDIGVYSTDLFKHDDALVHGKQTRLRLVNQDTNGDVVKQGSCSTDDVDMPVRDRVKGARTDRTTHDLPPG
jgi:hypothetical protein